MLKKITNLVAEVEFLKEDIENLESELNFTEELEGEKSLNSITQRCYTNQGSRTYYNEIKRRYPIFLHFFDYIHFIKSIRNNFFNKV